MNALVIVLLLIILILLVLAMRLMDHRDQLFEEIKRLRGIDELVAPMTKPDTPIIPQPAPMRKGHTCKSLIIDGKYWP